MSQEKQKPEWMHDPVVRDIPQEKLELLWELYQTGQGKSKNNLISSLLPLLGKAKKEGLTFTQAELSAAITAIKLHSSHSENEKIDEILKKTVN